MTGIDPAVLFEIIRESGLSYEQTVKSYIFTCPKCDKPKLYIRKIDGRFVCWKCRETENFQGRAEYALAALLNRSVTEIKGRLYGSGHVAVDVFLDFQLTDFFGEDDVNEEVSEIPTVGWPLDYYPIDHPFSNPGVEYLAGRCIPLDIAKIYNIHYSPRERRVVFPVQDHGRLYGWQGRVIIPTNYIDESGNEKEIPKILSSAGIPRDRALMFTDRLQQSEHAILCEGPVDAIKAHLCGGNVCAMGKAVQRGQMNLLINAGVKKIYLALDPDAADEMQRLMQDYFSEVELYEMVPKYEAGKKIDLGAMDFKEVQALFVGARRISPGHLFVYLNRSA